MILKKGKRIHKLEKPVDTVTLVSIENVGVKIALMQVPKDLFDKMVVGKEAHYGQPTHYTVNKDDIFVFPRPDKNYQCKIIGLYYIEQ